MEFPLSLDTHLPTLQREQPESEWIHTESVTGRYGITASVKNFDEVVDWQEHRRELTQGYYRLIHPPQVQMFQCRLQAKYSGFSAVLFTSGALAEKELKDLLEVLGKGMQVERHSGLPEAVAGEVAHVVDVGIAGVVLLEDGDLAEKLHERNRRRGGSLSARNVDMLLGSAPPEIPGQEVEPNCAAILLNMEKAEFVNFYPSGMGAVTAALDVLLTPERPHFVVLGNVYRDTHLLLEEQRWAGRQVQCDFLDTDDLTGLEDRLQDPRVAGVLIETITNPLIEIPDLPAIASLCRKADRPLLVDSTMAAPLNACPLELGATMVIHSTSKYLSGSNTHGGGIVLTCDADWAQTLTHYQEHYDFRLSLFEFPALLAGLQSYPQRILRFNKNGEALARMLREHPAVETVYFANQGRPEWLKGLASVVSCELKAPCLEKVALFFNAELPGVLKAPSLGSDQSLFCPYVLLAYYDKSDEYLRECNLSKTLLRFAAGSEEDFSGVLEGIHQALDSLL